MIIFEDGDACVFSGIALSSSVVRRPGNIEELLSYSRDFPEILAKFLEPHDNIGWLHHVAAQDYDMVTSDTVDPTSFHTRFIKSFLLYICDFPAIKQYMYYNYRSSHSKTLLFFSLPSAQS